jgi:hypothetical protein
MDAAVFIAIRQWRIDGVCRRPARMPATAIHEFLLCKNSKPENGKDAVFRQRKGLKRYPFLPEAKKIQA